jgi:putative GTP pyrophosphokinase
MTSDTEIRSEYEARYSALCEVAKNLEGHLSGYLNSVPRIDRVSARAKSPDRYVEKALKLDDSGERKYNNPKYEIQDQIGARITVFYISDIDRVKNEVQKYFRFIEMKNKTPTSDSEFGYFGLHFIIGMPSDIVPDDYEEIIPQFCELQIKTLFQHAWSEADHDLGYKSFRDLTTEERRKIAFTAAQAWGADTVFEELAKTLVLNDNAPTAIED